MSTHTLPSGLVCEVRGLAGRDGRILADEKKVRDQEVEDYVLDGAVKVLDPGPYKPTAAGGVDWNGVLVGDRSVALVAVRHATYPDDPYHIPMKCPTNLCREKFTWDVDVGKLLEMKVQDLALADRETFKGGNVFTDVIPGTSIPFAFQLLTGGMAKRAIEFKKAKRTGPRKMQDRQNELVDQLTPFIREIGGVKMKWDAIFDALEDLPLGPLDRLMPLIQSHDCGIDTTVEVECPGCKDTWEIQLPFVRAFFLPATSAMRRRTRETEKAKEQSEADDEA
jgi:hypothetical protein